MFKSIFSIFTDLIDALRLLPKAIFLLITFLQVGRRDLKQPEHPKEKNAELFLKIKEELKEDKDSSLKWKNYLGTCMCIQLIFLMLLLASVYYTSLSTILFSIFLILSFIIFGYKPMVLKNRACFSFREYLSKLRDDPLIVWLPNSLNLVEDLCQDQ